MLDNDTLRALDNIAGGVPLPGEQPVQEDSQLPEIKNWFRYHAPWGTQQVRYVHLRELGYELARAMLVHCNPSRERSLALTKLREAIMWANASIACNEPNPEVKP